MTRTIFEMTESMSNLKLEQNKYFQLLDEETKKKLLKGSRAYFKKGGMVQKFPLNLSMEAGIYKFLSNSVHSSPLSLMNYYGGSQSNPLDSLGVLFIAVETSNLYLATSINAYTRIRWKAAKLVNDEDKIFVKSIMNSSYIQKWIEYRKWLDDQHNFYKAIKS